MPYADRETNLAYLREYHKKKMELPGQREVERQRQRDRYKSDYESRVHQYNIERRLSGKRIPSDECKRPFLGYCELCGEDLNGDPRKKDYHHWDGIANLGMWLCHNCHMTAEAVDKRFEFIGRYRELKLQISKDYALRLMKDAGVECDANKE